MNCVIAGSGSDIAQGLRPRLEADGWKVEAREGHEVICFTNDNWDLLILLHGTLEPIRKFFDCSRSEWNESVGINSTVPLYALRDAWDSRNPNATVVFLGGPNMRKPSPTYTAYRAGKAVIESLVETLGVEYPDTRFRVLHPGVVNTKIHQQTLAAGHRAANYDRVMKIVNGTEPTVSHDEVYARLKALL